MNAVDVSTQGVEPPLWIERFREFAFAALDALKVSGWEVSVLFCSDTKMQELNRTYRGLDEATDVLSFSLAENGCRTDLPASEPVPVGDIIISLDTLKSHSTTFDVPEEEELKRLFVHGVLHLSGRDHASNDPGDPMLEYQEQVLNNLSEVRIF